MNVSTELVGETQSFRMVFSNTQEGVLVRLYAADDETTAIATKLIEPGSVACQVLSAWFRS